MTNFLNILSSLTEPAGAEPTNRRGALQKSGAMARKMAVTALPFGLGAVSFQARAASNTDALNLLLECKLALRDLYNQAAGASFSENATGVIGASDVKKAAAEILIVVNSHITLLTDAITAAGGTPVSPAFTFPVFVFEKRWVYMAVAQVLHDVSSRGAKYLLALLEGTHGHLMAAVKIQAADSRYASLWQIGRNVGTTQFYPTESGAYADLPSELTDFALAAGVNLEQVAYQGENNTTQLGTDVSTLTATTPEMVAAAFDEPLSEADVRSVLNIFKP